MYLGELKAEEELLLSRLDDLLYLLKQAKIDVGIVEIPEITMQQADAYIYHRFTYRSFTYLEKLIYQFNNDTVANYERSINEQKVRRQLNAVVAALTDIRVSTMRFEAYLDKMATIK